MSCSTWISYGYGFCLGNLIITDDAEKIDKFLDYAPEYKKRVVETFKESGITEPRFEDYEELFENSCFGIASLIKGVLNEHCGLEIFCSCEDYENDEYVMYCRDFPWNMSKEEKELTPEKLDEILSIVSVLFENPEDLSFGEVEAEDWG